MPVATMLPSTVHQPVNLTLGEVASLDCQVFDGWSAFSGPRFHRSKAPILEAYWQSYALFLYSIEVVNLAEGRLVPPRSAPRCVGCKRIIRIAGIHQIGTRDAQQCFDLLDRSPNCAARVAGLNLPLQLEEGLVGAIEALREDRCDVKERDRVYPEYGGRIGDVKLTGFKRTHVRCVRLIQQHREFAEDGTRFRHPGDLNAFLFDCDFALLKDQQPAGCRGGTEHGLAGLVRREWKRGELPLKDAHIGNEGHVAPERGLASLQIEHGTSLPPSSESR